MTDWEQFLKSGESVPPDSLDMAIKHIESGKSLYVATQYRVTVLNKKTLDRFRKANIWLLKTEGNGYRMKTGKTSVYLLPGQLKYGD